MKRLLPIYLSLMVLFFFTGCAGMREFFVDITEKNANKNNEKAPEVTQALPCSSYLEKHWNMKKTMNCKPTFFT